MEGSQHPGLPGAVAGFRGFRSIRGLRALRGLGLKVQGFGFGGFRGV